MGARVDNRAFQSAVEEYLTLSPLTASIRHANPNLHPMETEMEVETAKRGPRRKKPTMPLPMELLPRTTSLSSSASTSFHQHFWKFHLVKFGSDMYLTTNPTPRHLHCRSFPGYFISVEGNSIDYTLSFEDIETGVTYLRIRKRTTKDREFFRYKLRRARAIVNGRVSETNDDIQVYENYLWQELIPDVLFPSPPDVPMTSYHTEDFTGGTWNVGSIPRVRESRMNASESKYVGKHYIYFHDNFTQKPTGAIHNVPKVKAVFRPTEASTRKRVMHSLNRLLRIDSSGKKFNSDEVGSTVFSDIKSYFKAGDGLYGQHNPADDDPDKRTKYGWLTLYEDDEFFLQWGMFDLVVGLSVCMAYEKLIH